MNLSYSLIQQSYAVDQKHYKRLLNIWLTHTQTTWPSLSLKVQQMWNVCVGTHLPAALSVNWDTDFSSHNTNRMKPQTKFDSQRSFSQRWDKVRQNRKARHLRVDSNGSKGILCILMEEMLITLTLVSMYTGVIRCSNVTCFHVQLLCMWYTLDLTK